MNEGRICDRDVNFLVGSMIMASFYAFIIGAILCFVSMLLGIGVCCLSVVAMIATALKAGTTAMSWPEAPDVTDCWSEPKLTISVTGAFLKRVALAIVYKVVGKTVENRRGTYAALIFGAVIILISLLANWPRK